MAISIYSIGGYYINVYWWLVVVILLMAIGCYSINDYYWLYY